MEIEEYDNKRFTVVPHINRKEVSESDVLQLLNN